MNILFIADPNSIHDIRWINFFCASENFNCFIIHRKSHLKGCVGRNIQLNRRVEILCSVADHSTIRPWRNVIEAMKIGRAIRRNQIDILHILYAEPNSLWTIYKWYFGVRVVITTRGTDILTTIPSFFQGRSFLNRIVARQYRQALNAADAIFCTSRRQIEILNRLGVTSQAILVRTGVDFKSTSDASENIAERLGIKRPFILMPRSMRPLYNHEFTLDAIAILGPEQRKKFTFVFVDSDSKDTKYFAGIYRKAQVIDAEIRFLPSLTHGELIALFKQSTMVVMNPLSDGSPVTAMEAMACKVPVVLPPLPYDEDLFQGAFLFAEWSPLALRDKIEAVLRMDPSALSRLAECSFTNIFLHGNSDIEMLKVRAIYES